MVHSKSTLRRRRRQGETYLALVEGYESLHQAHDRLQWAFFQLYQQFQHLQVQELLSRQQTDQAQAQLHDLQTQQADLREDLFRVRAQNQSLSDQLFRAISACYAAEARAEQAERALFEMEVNYLSLVRRYESLCQLEDQLLTSIDSKSMCNGLSCRSEVGVDIPNPFHDPG